MIAHLRGKVISSSVGSLVLDVRGVGYEIMATEAVLRKLPDSRDDLSVLIFTDVKENAITLFGFGSLQEKEVFLLLKKVKGIGSRLALGIISAVGAEKLLGIIGRSDAAALQRVPGIGKKTAQRLIVELRETVGALAEDAEPLAVTVTSGQSGASAGEIPHGVLGDAMLALEKLGFSGEKARAAVAQAGADWTKEHSGEPTDAGELLRLSLARL